MQDAATESLPRAGTSCPSCGAPAERGQLVCLECGGRIGLDYRRPPGWKVPAVVVGAVLLAAGTAFGLGLHEITSNAGNEVAKAPPGKPVRKAPAKKATAKKKASPAKPAKAAKPAKKPTPAKAAAAVPGVPGWPAGRDGYTVVLLSASDRQGASSFAKTAKQGGTKVGALRSGQYPSLQKGFWIVFSGVYRTRPQAERASKRMSRGFPGAFPQFVDGSKRR
jgi:sporulation related protein